MISICPGRGISCPVPENQIPFLGAPRALSVQIQVSASHTKPKLPQPHVLLLQARPSKSFSSEIAFHIVSSTSRCSMEVLYLREEGCEGVIERTVHPRYPPANMHVSLETVSIMHNGYIVARQDSLCRVRISILMHMAAARKPELQLFRPAAP
jgi:hypothetical protein